MNYFPSEYEVKQIQDQYRFDYLQAYYHLQGKHRLIQQVEQQRQETYDRALKALLQS